MGFFVQAHTPSKVRIELTCDSGSACPRAILTTRPYTRTIRRWIGDDIDMFRCSPCGTFSNQPSNMTRYNRSFTALKMPNLPDPSIWVVSPHSLLPL